MKLTVEHCDLGTWGVSLEGDCGDHGYGHGSSLMAAIQNLSDTLEYEDAVLKRAQDEADRKMLEEGR